jgi:selenide,water dikinase
MLRGVTVSLTALAPTGGCAAKYSAARLEELLRGFVPAEAENLLVGLAPADDAVVYRLDEERALVFTLDFFPPLVDDPALFGRIAATNALNDVFAMGGLPLLALSIAAFPESLPNETLAAVFGAADEQVRAAGAILAGGHTLRDEEPKYGLAVVGTVHPEAFWSKAGARPGDAVFLTKPLGTGLLLHAAREGRRHEEGLARAVDAMTELSREAADVLRPVLPHAVTDVTGFGLLGHTHEVAERSGVRIELDAASLPRFPGALEAAAVGTRTGGDRRNRDFAAAHVEAVGVAEDVLALAYDPQTSGGLLVTLPADKGAVLEATFAARGLFLARIGRVTEGVGVSLA